MISILLVACVGPRPLMPAPNIYTGENAQKLFVSLPAELQTNRIDILYLTDREPEVDDGGKLGYGPGRSRSLAFGSATVAIEPEMSWERLEQISTERNRSKRLTLRLDSIVEQGRFQETPPPLVMIDGKPQPDPVSMEKTYQTDKKFRAELLRRLEQSPRAEILMFVHGFNNTFEDAALTLAESWHYMGREFVPILYTWPAGLGGVSGYIYDRESGEFTVHHLKQMIRKLSLMPEIDAFHILAHSRGTDVLSSAMRELALVARASGDSVNTNAHKSHIILAAPDLDMDVVSQRIIAEQVGRENKNITIYTSQDDKAIGLAEHFFKSTTRIGRLDDEDLSATDSASIQAIEGVSFIDVLDTGQSRTSHGYFHSDPAAVSDLIMMVRYGREPGAENGRPLKPVTAGFWELESGYPFLPNEEAQ